MVADVVMTACGELERLSHWDEIEPVRRERGHIAASWRALTGERSVTVGVQRIEIEPGRWSTPLHLENSEEEIFYVLSGTGVSLQWDGETTEAFAVGAGDCLVHLASEYAHTLLAGADGLDVLAFGERHYPMGSAFLPRAGVSWGLGAWTRVGGPGGPAVEARGRGRRARGARALARGRTGSSTSPLSSR